MLELITILRDIILPVFIIMTIGYILQKKFSLDVQTLARLNIYFVVPAFIFVKLSSTEIAFNMFIKVLFFIGLFVFILYVLSFIVAHLLKLEHGKKVTFTNSIIFFNSGNYAVPVNDLVFRGDPFAMSIQVIVLMFQNIFIFSYGIFSLQSMSAGKLKAAFAYFKMPVMYAMIGGLIVNALNISVPGFIWVPANYIANAMIAIALLTLGAQVAQLKLTAGLGTVYFSLVLRLIAGPLVALGMIFVFGISGITAQALLIASSTPTAVNSAVIAQEYKNHPDLAAQIVLFSTLASAFTVTFFIYVGRMLFA
ncbi:AEC family transporter [Pseudogracilibacillus auburnensis]|uniref:Permease n=1 Tax=Pseudogracilibacillus auburnensis TaxID=1494959 RepID=A0A2V3VYU6_9BACI|nr:AEC family transporter [Pseudogracilibacillus auburnensis]PXW85928.1 hypothetical protein DFR56_10991 [Pseudogracilibacillus auburnensis]